LGVRESFIPVSQEYDYIEQYLVIQRFKMGRTFRVDWDVEEDLWSYPIPKLILQPIVENALIHGIAKKKSGRINVQVFKQRHMLVMKVTDNGRGMDGQKPPDEQASLRKVGLSNVRERISLIYGNEYGIEIDSVKGAYTTVKLILPYKEGEICQAF
jgi:two-component system sensor histidine kinase YesM